ncbi:THAP domain [Popillia japonica]|uniref:THAP domain n=1 Tax=Popillia japonica TaxID=7064 RepID=A0AAW1KII3_POPJA
MPRICCVPNCKRGYTEGNKDIHLFQLPEDEVIRNKWIAQIGGQEVLRRAARVCDIHFDVCYFKKNSNVTAFEESPDEAVDVAQPSTSQDFQSPTVTASVQTTQILSATSPRKARLRSEIRVLQRKIQHFEKEEDAANQEPSTKEPSEDEFIKFCQAHFNEATA